MIIADALDGEKAAVRPFERPERPCVIMSYSEIRVELHYSLPI